MRVLIATSSWPAHYFPMVPVGWALRAAGHEVRVLCAPRMTTVVENSGLSPVPLLDNGDPLFWSRVFHQKRVLAGTAEDNGLPLLHPLTGQPMSSPDEFDFAAYQRANQKQQGSLWWDTIQQIGGFVDAWRPNLVIHDMMCEDGPACAIVANAPAVLALWGLVGTHEPDPALDLVPTYSNLFLEVVGVRARGRQFISTVLDPCPKSLAPPTEAQRLAVRFVPYNGPGSAPTWAVQQSPRRRIALTWGSTSGRHGPEAFMLPEILASLADLDAEIAVVVRPADVAMLGDRLPANATVLPQCPLAELLASCDAIVHHGGAGVVMTALACGTPQLTVAYEEEQHANGIRVAAAGAGRSMRAAGADGAAIRAELDLLLADDDMRAAALRLRDEMAASPSPAQLVPELERLAECGAPPATVDWERAREIERRLAGRS
jgi:UDP:flavonoid glycosyltransferase YjiC (YdhE family)